MITITTDTNLTPPPSFEGNPYLHADKKDILDKLLEGIDTTQPPTSAIDRERYDRLAPIADEILRDAETVMKYINDQQLVVDEAERMARKPVSGQHINSENPYRQTANRLDNQLNEYYNKVQGYLDAWRYWLVLVDLMRDNPPNDAADDVVIPDNQMRLVRAYLIRRETDKAYMISSRDQTFGWLHEDWLPKSRCTVHDGHVIAVEKWLIQKKSAFMFCETHREEETLLW